MTEVINNLRTIEQIDRPQALMRFLDSAVRKTDVNFTSPTGKALLAVSAEIPQAGELSIVYRGNVEGEPAVLKILFPNYAKISENYTKNDLRTGFDQEISILSALGSDGDLFPKFYGSGEIKVGSNDYPFLVREDLPISSESALSGLPIELRNGRLVKLMKDMNTALHYAQEKGVLLTDLSPENIRVRSLDERSLGDPEKGIQFVISDTGHSTTKDSGIVGSPEVKPPEIRNISLSEADKKLSVDKRTQVWLVASLTHHFLGGEEALPGFSPDPETLNTVPDKVKEVLLKALQFEKENRYQSTFEFTQELEAALESANIPE